MRDENPMAPGSAAEVIAVVRPSRYNRRMDPKPKQRAGRTRRRPADPLREAAEYGIDVDMLRDNLALTVAERLRRHDIALATVEMLRKARFL